MTCIRHQQVCYAINLNNTILRITSEPMAFMPQRHKLKPFSKAKCKIVQCFLYNYYCILVQITVRKIGALWIHWTPDSLYFSQIRLKYT